MPSTNQFKEIQSGTPIRVILQDASVLDLVFRRFLKSESTIVGTTPISGPDVNNPAAQDTHYIDNYVRFVSPIPPINILQISGFIGQNVLVTFSSVGPDNTATGIVTAADASLGLVELDNTLICKDFWSIETI